jgi:hypothetical protein
MGRFVNPITSFRSHSSSFGRETSHRRAKGLGSSRSHYRNQVAENTAKAVIFLLAEQASRCYSVWKCHKTLKLVSDPPREGEFLEELDH